LHSVLISHVSFKFFLMHISNSIILFLALDLSDLLLSFMSASLWG